MSKNLLIVESPAKCKTLLKYLGDSYTVLASYGHVRDLLPKSGAVNTEHNFEPTYELIEKNIKHLDAIREAVQDATTLYLATDPDREGEIISWHINEILTKEGLLQNKEVHRVVFNEITKPAVLEAIQHPRAISPHLVNAQQARRILDYLVGFNLSPLLWKKIRYGLSAGRVQSPALRMIVERESEIESFKSTPYWKIFSDFISDSKQKCTAQLIKIDDKKIDQFHFANSEDVDACVQKINETSNGIAVVSEVEKKIRKRQSAPPFTTSTLQQEAVRKLGFGTKRTMQIAQKLYEGMSIGGTTTGLITYMRTDSTRLSDEGIKSIRAVIGSIYGKEYLPEHPRQFVNKSKNSQEAHEAIRPVSAEITPDSIKTYLEPEQFRLYQLIWRRAVASQMIHATIQTSAVNFEVANRFIFRATGSQILHPGFMSVYQISNEEVSNSSESASDESTIIPEFNQGENVGCESPRSTEHSTEPPPRYSEASLVKALEEYGIGRPSTYASIISTLVSRQYVSLEEKQFKPTDTGVVLNDFLCNHFHKYVDYGFTAKLEDTLDEISRGETEWLPILNEFWNEFSNQVKEKDISVTREEAIKERNLGVDPVSGRKVTVRYGRYGPHVQIGTREDVEKPIFGPLLPGMKSNDVTLELALDLCTLPKELGKDESGEAVTVGVGSFGPYVRFDKTKYISIKDKNPLTIKLEDVLVLINERREFDKNKIIKEFADSEIKILNGMYGAYIATPDRNVRIPKTILDPKTLTLAECVQIVEKTPISRFARFKRAKKIVKKATKKTVKKTPKETPKETPALKTSKRKKTVKNEKQ
ncbi:MAG: type I DNA topoisomerase [Methylacidiphilales bacterium]|nr:type I DNA topoisomerase [Candidatus Methylacidiphilales bacterium]